MPLHVFLDRSAARLVFDCNAYSGSTSLKIIGGQSEPQR